MERVILAGPCISEFGWENLRVAPYVLWNKVIKHKNNPKLIVYTREDRFDLYGEYADEFIPLKIPGDYTKLKSDCFKLLGFSNENYQKLIKEFFERYSKNGNIIKEHLYANIDGKAYANKKQFKQDQMLFDFRPRKENKQVVDLYIPSDKKIIVLASRYRQGIKRNWPHWLKLFELIKNDKSMDQYNFIICGKDPEYIKANDLRFLDINHLPIVENTSLVGLTIEVLKRSILTVGSQSGIPNLSNLVGTRNLQWGHEKEYHQKTYNVKKTECHFIEDKKYNIEPEKILNEMKKMLKGIKK